MRSVFSFKTLLFLMTLIGLLMVCGNAFPQSVNFKIDPPDLKEWYKQTEEYPILKNLVESQAKTIAELEKSLAIKTKELELEQRENDINNRMLKVKDREIAGLIRNFDQMKEVADRAIKLAEVSKPKSNWQLQGLLGIVSFLAGVYTAK